MIKILGVGNVNSGVMSGDVFFRRSHGGGVDCDGDAVDDLNTGFIRKSVRWEDQQRRAAPDSAGLATNSIFFCFLFL